MVRARQADVAREAGVSPRTVSNVINGYPHIRPETARRVNQAIDKLGYVINRSARTLRTGRIGIIGLAVPDLSVPYFAELVTELTTAAEQRGYTILVEVTGGRADRERHVVSGLRPQTIDGLIISPLQLQAAEVAEAAAGAPLVVLGEWGARDPELIYVGVDNVAAADAATQHLIERGRRRIAVIGSVRGRHGGAADQRIEGYRQALLRSGRTAPEELVVEVDLLDRQNGLTAMQQLLALPEPPDAVVCVNDLVAVGASWAAQEAGLDIPGDLAVIGWDDSPEVSWSRPPLSSVRADVAQIAAQSLTALIDQVEGRPAPARRRLLVGYRLVVRASTDPDARAAAAS